MLQPDVRIAQEISAKLVNALEGEDRMKLWEEQKRFITEEPETDE